MNKHKRQLKFRIWDSQKKDWVKIEDIIVQFQNGWINLTLDANDHLIFEQYTGSKDKNGKEIYEGDIWKSPDGKSTIEIIWISEEEGSDWTGWNIGYTETMNEGEVIGNIHKT